MLSYLKTISGMAPASHGPVSAHQGKKTALEQSQGADQTSRFKMMEIPFGSTPFSMQRVLCRAAGFILAAAMFGSATTCRSAAADFSASGARLQLGGNVNENLDWLLPSLMDQSHAGWVRGFVPAFQFMRGERSFNSDAGLKTLNAAARSGRHVVLSIKWDCKARGEDGRVPLPDSGKEKQWFKFADDLLDATRGSVSILVLDNELLIDTQKADLEPGPGGQVPMVVFLRRLAAHIAGEHRAAADGKPLPIFAGGWTRLDLDAQRMLPATQASIDWVKRDPNIAGADYHLHQPDMRSSEEAMRYMHEQIPNKPLIVTEFSLVWKWKAHLGDRIAATPAGVSFAHQYSLPPAMTVAEFFGGAFRNRVPQAEWIDFLKSQPWFEADYLARIAPELEANGVVVATYAFTLNPFAKPGGQGQRLDSNTNPWFLNDLFVPTLVSAPSPTQAAVNYGMFDCFVQYQMKNGSQR